MNKEENLAETRPSSQGIFKGYILIEINVYQESVYQKRFITEHLNIKSLKQLKLKNGLETS